MKIIHLNTYDGNGGAGRACLRLSQALNEIDSISSQVYVHYKFGKNPLIVSLDGGNKLKKALSAFGILLERYVSSFFTKKLKIPFSIPVWGRDLSDFPDLLDADLIHLHWVNHAFLRPRDLEKLVALNKPIVWTFHDSNAYTGGCHVRYSCDRFEQECGNCPLLKASNDRDISHKIWKAKEQAYSVLNFHIVAPSWWKYQSVKRSKLLANNAMSTIANTLETDIFRPVGKDYARKQLNLDPGKFIMLSGFMPSRKDLHKGTPYLLEALKLFAGSGRVDKDKVELIVFGNRDSKSVPEFEVDATFLGTISDDEKLALCYSAADVFITPSLEDNLPNTVMESLACGTPVVSFSTGGIPDMVDHMKNGYLAEYKSSGDLAAGIEWIYNYPVKEELNRNARSKVMDNFSETVIAGKHIELYKSLLKNNESRI